MTLHPSHVFGTEPLADGCGGCGCLPGDPEAKAPCSPPSYPPPVSTAMAMQRRRVLERMGRLGLCFEGVEVVERADFRPAPKAARDA